MDIQKEIALLKELDIKEVDPEVSKSDGELFKISEIYKAFASQLNENEQRTSDLKSALSLVEEQIEDKREQIRALKNEIKKLQRDEQSYQNELLDIIDLIGKLNTFSSGQGNSAVTEQVSVLFKHAEHRLKEIGISRIEALGEHLDPSLHEVIGTKDSPQNKPFEVIEIVRDGFIRGEKVLRKAVVITAKS